jgi:site-specific DNA-adenine methylase
MSNTSALKPFWRYYGGKFRAAPRYPIPDHDTIVEPFAGAAGYSTRYPERRVILVEKYPVIAEMWRYLIRVSATEIRRIPLNPQHIDDLPTWVPQPARDLIGWWLNNATVSPCRQLSSGRIQNAANGRKFEGWTEATRERIATQVEKIRHWQIIEGDYTSSPLIEATWFVDPPYNNRAGSYYVHNNIDYKMLALWCRIQRGQKIVCENEGATWLPFRPFMTLKPGINGKGSKEVIWP